MEKAAKCGEPSYVWRAGQERRLSMILKWAGINAHGTVLDVGCGIGLYLQRLAPHAGAAYGLEFDFDRGLVAASHGLSIVCGAGEHLPFPSASFDLALSHEVLEHVMDDRRSLAEIIRILRVADASTGSDGGRLILFVPNRGYPFETHGIYWRGKYHFGNIPLVNYLPCWIRDRLVPHVRVYSSKRLHALFRDLPVRVLYHTMIFGAYDNLIARWPRLGRILRAFLHAFEKTPLRVLGLSHFLVVERIA
jgi:SAM-dependent methyltransferase